MPDEVVLSQEDVEVALAVHGQRDFDDRYVTPGDVFKVMTYPWARERFPNVQKLAAHMRSMAERGILERDPWVKQTRYREVVGVIAAIDAARPFRWHR